MRLGRSPGLVEDTGHIPVGQVVGLSLGLKFFTRHRIKSISRGNDIIVSGNHLTVTSLLPTVTFLPLTGLLDVVVIDNHTEEFRRSTDTILCKFESGHLLHRIRILRQNSRLAEREVVGVSNRNLVRLVCALGSNENHTESSTGTIDRGRSGILQDGDALNILGVQVRNILHGNTIHHDKRAGILTVGQRTQTTDLKGRGTTDTTIVVHNGQAGNGTLEGLAQIGDRTGLKGPAHINRRDGTRQVDLLLRTITDDHDFIKELVVFGKDNAKVRTGGDRLGSITDAGNVQRRSGGSLDSEVTLSVRHGTRHRSFHDNAGTRNGIALGIHNRTGSTVLCIRSKAQQGEHHNCACSKHFVYLHRKQILVNNNRVNNYFFRISIQ